MNRPRARDDHGIVEGLPDTATGLMCWWILCLGYMAGMFVPHSTAVTCLWCAAWRSP